ncbi:MAG TPA: hypothetical protein VF435_09590 [Pyrinomonadaceae bacterium]
MPTKRWRYPPNSSLFIIGCGANGDCGRNHGRGGGVSICGCQSPDLDFYDV